MLYSVAQDNLNINLLQNFKETKSTILFGTGNLGKIALKAINNTNIEVIAIADNDEGKWGKQWNGYDVINPKDIKNYNQVDSIIIASLNFPYMRKQVLDVNKSINIYDFDFLLNEINLEECNTDWSADRCKEQLDLYTYSVNAQKKKGDLFLNSIDLVLTEKCSLKCKDCSNLMQYYEKAEDTDQVLLFRSIDKIMDSIDSLGEFRVLGGDPFMYKKMYEVVNKLVTYNKVKKVVIYTNGKIVPKGENLECLRHKKVMLDITNYGESSTAHSKVVEIAKKENISFTTFRCNTWSDCGRIIPYSNKSEKDIKHLFNNCCNSDLVSLLHGKLYRCPFSANGVNLKAIPQNKKDEVDLTDNTLNKEDLREQIKKLCYEKEYLTACYYCNGRDYSTTNIPAALQTKIPLEYNLIKD